MRHRRPRAKSVTEAGGQVTVDRSVTLPVRGEGRTINWVENDTKAWNQSTRLETLNRTRNGVRNPRWKTIIQSGGNATTSLSATYDTLEWTGSDAYVSGTASSTDPRRWKKENRGSLAVCNNQYGTPMLYLNFTAADVSRAENLARAKFYKKVNEVYTRFAGMTFLGELKETLHMLRRPAEALRQSAKNYLDSLKKRKKADPRNWAKGLSGTWLEHSFGWTPLMHDIEDAVDAYDKLCDHHQDIKISASAVVDGENFKVLPSVMWDGVSRGYNGANHFVVNSTAVTRYMVRYKGAVNARLEANRWSDAELMGFSPNQFIPTAWELLPWSFLIDYFTNIGDILNSAFTHKRDIRWTNKTVRKENYIVISGKLTPSTTLFPTGVIDTAYGSFGSAKAYRKTLTRSAVSGVPLPDLQLSIPRGDQQLLNIAALLGQAFKLHPQQRREHSPRSWFA